MKTADAPDESGWDVLAAVLLTLALGRLGLEEATRLLPLLVYGILALFMIPGSSHISRPLQNIVNSLAFLLVAVYLGLAHRVSEIPVAKGWVWASAVIAFFVTFHRWGRYLERSQGRAGLPRPLRAQFLVPATLVGIIIYGCALALPVGPLSDEGMVLYMEGGCDWGNSNIFFFAKLGLLLAVNAGMSLALRSRITEGRAFLPHFLVAIGLIGFWWNDVSCDHYYGHPQGNLGQMVVEASALALLLITYIPKLVDASSLWRLIGVLVLNTWAVAAFHLGLLLFPHWTWMHTLITSLLTLMPAVSRWISRDAQQVSGTTMTSG